jgi:hypothetical protein
MGLRAAFRKHTTRKKALKLGKEAFQLAKQGNFRDALALIDQGGDVNYRDNWNYYIGGVLHMPQSVNCNMGFIALEKYNMEALEGLLQRRLDPNGVVLSSKPGRPLLEVAIDRRNREAVDLLVKAGARTDVTLTSMKTIKNLAKEKGMSLSPG